MQTAGSFLVAGLLKLSVQFRSLIAEHGRDEHAAPTRPGRGGRSALGKNSCAGQSPRARTYDYANFCRISVTVEDDREAELPTVNYGVPTVAHAFADLLETKG